MGREGEVVADLLREFERSHPGVRVKVQQLPWTAAHGKLLTVFAGDGTPDVCQLGNTWIPELVALNALEPVERYAAASPVGDAADYFAGIWDTNRVEGALWGAVVRRHAPGVLPWRSAETGGVLGAGQVMAGVGGGARRGRQARTSCDRFGILLPLNELEPLLVLALQQDEPLLRQDGRGATSVGRASAARWRSTSKCPSAGGHASAGQ